MDIVRGVGDLFTDEVRDDAPITCSSSCTGEEGIPVGVVAFFVTIIVDVLIVTPIEQGVPEDEQDVVIVLGHARLLTRHCYKESKHVRREQ